MPPPPPPPWNCSSSGCRPTRPSEGPRHLQPAQRVGAAVLHRLELADGATELDPVPGVPRPRCARTTTRPRSTPRQRTSATTSSTAPGAAVKRRSTGRRSTSMVTRAGRRAGSAARAGATCTSSRRTSAHSPDDGAAGMAGTTNQRARPPPSHRVASGSVTTAAGSPARIGSTRWGSVARQHRGRGDRRGERSGSSHPPPLLHHHTDLRQRRSLSTSHLRTARPIHPSSTKLVPERRQGVGRPPPAPVGPPPTGDCESSHRRATPASSMPSGSNADGAVGPVMGRVTGGSPPVVDGGRALPRWRG